MDEMFDPRGIQAEHLLHIHMRDHLIELMSRIAHSVAFRDTDSELIIGYEILKRMVDGSLTDVEKDAVISIRETILEIPQLFNETYVEVINRFLSYYGIPEISGIDIEGPVERGRKAAMLTLRNKQKRWIQDV